MKIIRKWIPGSCFAQSDVSFDPSSVFLSAKNFFALSSSHLSHPLAKDKFVAQNFRKRIDLEVSFCSSGNPTD